jgi:hypothetical protein
MPGVPVVIHLMRAVGIKVLMRCLVMLMLRLGRQ